MVLTVDGPDLALVRMCKTHLRHRWVCRVHGEGGRVSETGLVTILFTDLVGSTEMATTMGDVAADDLRRQHFAHLREAIAATDGNEVKTIGDAVMVAYKGATDALAGGVAMQRAVERHNRTLDGHRLEMRVGISVGDASFENGDWFGTPVVEAARLCSAAAGGQILVSDLVRALAGSRSEFELRPLGTRELKGLAGPIAVCDVEWQVPVDTVRVPLPVFVDTAPAFGFAGRVDELESLQMTWKETVEGARRVVLVSGEPGIGKTRLISELVRHAYDSGTTVLWGRCDEELGVPFEPFAEALRHYTHVVPPERLRAELGPLGGELTRVLPELAGRVPGLAAPIVADPETERHRLFEAVCDLLSEMSHAAPVVLVLDDIHWADKPSLLLLRHLLRAATPMRLLVLATYRDTDLDRTHPLSDVLAQLRREPGVTRLDLVGLDQSEVVALLESAAGHDLDEPGLGLARALQQETEGNPFFVGEVLRHLAESGSIVQRDGQWTSDRTLADVGIPEGIREVIGRRLSRLSDAANRALALGAVIGAEFDLATIEGAGGPKGDELFDALDEAVRHSIVREVPGAVGRYAFAHALMRSALYEELTTNRRVRMHWQIANAVEQRYQNRLDAHLSVLAHHFSEGALAGDPLKAADYCRRAGEKAVGELAFESAVGHFERGLGAIELLPDADFGVRCDLQIALASALFQAGDAGWRAAMFAAADSARAAHDSERLARTVMVRGQAGPSGSAVDDENVALLEEALAGLGEPRTGLRSLVQMSLAVELQWGPQLDRRRALAKDALEMAREVGDPAVLAYALSSTWTLVDGTRPFQADQLAYATGAEAVARESGDQQALGSSLTQRGWSMMCLGDGAGGAALIEAASSLFGGLRRPRLDWVARNWAVALATFAGDLARADQLAAEAVQMGLAAGIGESGVIGAYGAVLYHIRMGQGRIGELVPLLETRVAAAPDAPVWRVALVGALTESDRLDEARVHFDWLAGDGCARVLPDVEWPVIMCGLARLCYRLQPSTEVIEDIYARLAPFGGTFNHTGATVADPNDLGLAQAAAALGRHDAADDHFARAVALCERAGARVYLARSHQAWAQVSADRGDVANARHHAEVALGFGGEYGMDGPHGVVARCQTLLAQL